MAPLSTMKSLQGENLSAAFASASTWLLIGALGYASALLVIEFLPTNTASKAVARPLTARQSSSPNTVESLSQQIVSAHLFGAENVKPEPSPLAKKAAEAPKSRLNVKLAGIMATGDPKMGHALIGGGREDKVVAVGEKIERATLEEVYPFHIVILNGGKRERIELPNPKLGTGGSIASSSPASGGGSRPATSADPVARAPQGSAVDMSQLPQTPGALRDYMVRNPSTMQQLMDVRPFRQNGRVVGYKLNPKQDASIMRNFGIEPGDVVVALNGVKLDNQRRGLKALRQLVSAQQVDMTVLRNGAEIPISISLQ